MYQYVIRTRQLIEPTDAIYTSMWCLTKERAACCANTEKKTARVAPYQPSIPHTVMHGDSSTGCGPRWPLGWDWRRASPTYPTATRAHTYDQRSSAEPKYSIFIIFNFSPKS